MQCSKGRSPRLDKRPRAGVEHANKYANEPETTLKHFRAVPVSYFSFISHVPASEMKLKQNLFSVLFLLHQCSGIYRRDRIALILNY